MITTLLTEHGRRNRSRPGNVSPKSSSVPTIRMTSQNLLPLQRHRYYIFGERKQVLLFDR